MLEAEGPGVAHVHGVPGVGKSTLLRALVARASSKGHAAALLDCNVIEPTEQGFFRALRGTGLLAKSGKRVRGLVVLDNYEQLQLLDAWIRERLVPLQPEMRLVLGARRPPGPAWIASDISFLSVRLKELEAGAALELLEASGLAKAAARRMLGFTRGHPLALRLAAAAAGHHPGEVSDELAVHEVVTQLSALFLADADITTRQALEAMSTVRRATEPMLAAMLGIPSAAGLHGSLQECSVVEARGDGLALQPTVHEIIARRLRAADPERFTACRRAAWRKLEAQASEVATSDLWRYTADVIYLIDNPIVREAFFPSGAPQLSVESALAADHEALMRIAERHDGKEGRRHAEHWWRVMPSAFRVVRAYDRDVVGYYCMFDPASVAPDALAADPVTRAWHAHLPRHLRAPRNALFLRRWLGDEAGEAPSPVQAACWLDVKRAYVELRPSLQRVYLGVERLEPYAPAATELGFELCCQGKTGPLVSAVLEFGAGSVDAWLRRLVRKELRLAAPIVLDEATRTVNAEAGQVPLTRLEHGVLRALMRAEGSLLRRQQLLDEVWGERKFAVGSNVLDVVVLALRKKLGPQAGSVVTVRGIGYRFDSSLAS
jgi:hypothetical protein